MENTTQEYMDFLMRYRGRMEKEMEEKPSFYWAENPDELPKMYNIEAWMTRRVQTSLKYV